jgi:N-methylhydantoinase B
MPADRKTPDPVFLEIVWSRLTSIVDEAAAAVLRTAFSTVVRESHDLCCMLTDEQGQALVQATDSIPSFIGTIPRTVRHFLSEFSAKEMRPGDVFITNDPWLGTGHLPDITVAKPIFFHKRLVGFSASTAHSADIGGRRRSTEAREIFEEGLQIPLMKLMEEGSPNETFLSLLRSNVRVPDLIIGDLWAQLTALDLMEERLKAMMREYGMRSLRAVAKEILGRSERAVRQAIRAMPDGTYRSSFLTDGLELPMNLSLAITIQGEDILLDYAGTSPQVDRAINVPLCYTLAMSAYGVKCVAAPAIPNNEGSIRPITVTAPAGCLLNAVYPAPVASRSLTGHFIPSLVLSAFSKVVPDSIMAGAGSPLWSVTQSGVDEKGKTFSFQFFFNGGMGGNAKRDGQSCLSWPMNVSSTPIEVIEQVAPLRVRYRKLRPSSGGVGHFRGGLGQEVLMENRSQIPSAFFISAERTHIPAPGIVGGESGAKGEVWIKESPVEAKRQYILKKGDTVRIKTPGGGGFGSSARRPSAATTHDCAMGYEQATE